MKGVQTMKQYRLEFKSIYYPGICCNRYDNAKEAISEAEEIAEIETVTSVTLLKRKQNGRFGVIKRFK